MLLAYYSTIQFRDHIPLEKYHPGGHPKLQETNKQKLIQTTSQKQKHCSQGSLRLHIILMAKWEHSFMKGRWTIALKTAMAISEILLIDTSKNLQDALFSLS